MPKNLLPLQSGVGNVANAVMAGFVDSDLKDLTVYTEVIQDGMLDLIDAGKLNLLPVRHSARLLKVWPVSIRT